MYFLSILTILFSTYLSILIHTSSPSPFITTWNTELPGTSCNACVEIPTYSFASYEYDVDWDNDGIWDDLNVTGNAFHDYGTPGIYTISIRKTFPQIYFNNSGDAEKLISIDQWGNNVWSSMEHAFDGCTNLAGQASDKPELVSVESMNSMFAGATSFNQDISDWDVFYVTDMRSMFKNAKTFNQNISLWKVDNVMYMGSMFKSAEAFNQDISEWKVGNVISMDYMFYEASSFNQDISNWEVSSVSDMSYMFLGASIFNHDISGWKVGNVLYMFNMFQNATSFNQNVSAWDVSSVEDMQYMFYNATSFNQDISSWDFSSAYYLANMLNNSGMDVNNYDLLLRSLADQTSFINVDLGADNLKYCNGAASRDSLVQIYGWTITGDSHQSSNLNSLQANTANWYGSKANWMQGHYPTKCDVVIISNNRTTAVASGDKAYGKALRVDLGCTLEVELGAELEIGEN